MREYTKMIWSWIFQLAGFSPSFSGSCIFQPCSMVHHFQVLHSQGIVSYRAVRHFPVMGVQLAPPADVSPSGGVRSSCNTQYFHFVCTFFYVFMPLCSIRWRATFYCVLNYGMLDVRIILFWRMRAISVCYVRDFDILTAVNGVPTLPRFFL